MIGFRRKLSILIAVIAAFVIAAPKAHAITKDEMDRAKAVTAQWYLRWVNNGSDYLDNLNPQSMADLESKLKDKEKENIKAFKNVGTPSDYASWDKEKAVEYWSTTFFSASGLNDKGRGAKARVRKKLLALSFTDPADSPKEEPAKEETPKEAEQAQPAEEGAPDAAAAPVEELPTAEEIVDQANAGDSVAVDNASAEKSSDTSSSTWLYIVALVVLIGVVVWLVIFASKTMQNSSRAANDIKDEEEPESTPGKSERRESASQRIAENEAAAEEQLAVRSEQSLREKFARQLAGKDEEIRGLNREIHSLRDESMRLSEENRRLSMELQRAKRELLNIKNQDFAVAGSALDEVEEVIPERRPKVADDRRSEEPAHRPAHRESNVREIYLGRVNTKGIFVRADRAPVKGKSMFVLQTTDSYTGTFRVLQSASTIDMALDNPEHYLAGGCVAKDLTDTTEADGIQTLASGTAIFEDGCWRVLRKAKIAYE